MTETEWLECVDPCPMLEYLNAHDLLSNRKQRLFDCACVRRIWHLLHDPRGRRAVEAAERYADGDASLDELRETQAIALAAADAQTTLYPPGTPDSFTVLAAAAETTWEFRSGADPIRHAAEALAWEGLNYNVRSERLLARNKLAEEKKTQASLLREIVGNPYLKHSISPSFVAEELARGIYMKGEFGILPTLGEALQKDGCDSPKILAHCWLPGPHVKGCWVVDFVLGNH